MKLPEQYRMFVKTGYIHTLDPGYQRREVSHFGLFDGVTTFCGRELGGDPLGNGWSFDNEYHPALVNVPHGYCITCSRRLVRELAKCNEMTVRKNKA